MAFRPARFLCKWGAILALIVAIALPIAYKLTGGVLSEGNGLDIPTSLKGKTVLVTGSSAGIGHHAAREFARRGAHVIVTGRTWTKTDAARLHIQAAGDSVGATTTTMTMDLANFSNIRDFVREMGSQKVDYLILNAGLGGGTKPMEKVYTANHFGHFLLFELLRPLLVKGAPVVIVSAASMWQAGWAGLVPGYFETMGWSSVVDWPPAKDHVSQWGGHQDWYMVSKLANWCFAQSLRRKYPDDIKVSVLVPGRVGSDIMGPAKDACKHFFFWQWCADPADSGRLEFQAAFVSADPAPEVVYAYWWPEVFYKRYASTDLIGWRTFRGALFGYPSFVEKPTYGVLHGSVGPVCNELGQDVLWNYSMTTTGLA